MLGDRLLPKRCPLADPESAPFPGKSIGPRIARSMAGQHHFPADKRLLDADAAGGQEVGGHAAGGMKTPSVAHACRCTW
jgi:hypothetical protein